MFVERGLDLVVRQVVQLSDLLTRIDALSNLDIQQTQFSVDGGTHLQIVLTFADQENVLTHVGQVVFHLRQLCRAVEAVLDEALRDQRMFAGSQLVVLLRLQELLLTDEVFCHEAFVLLVGAFFPLRVNVQLRQFRLVVQTVLLHGNQRVAQ